MQKDKLVSIIIPVYNVDSFLREALDSVLLQTYSNLEIIIIDDGSTDGSGKICDEYAERDHRVIVIHQENRGLSAARNVGLDRMAGDAVTFLDSDDAYHPQYVEKMIEALIREGTDLVICKYTKHKTKGRMFVQEDEEKDPPATPGKYNRVSALCALADKQIDVQVWNKLYWAKYWKDKRFPEGYVHEDYELTYMIFDQCRDLYVMDDALYMHRKRLGSITNTCSFKNVHDRLMACDRVNAYIQNHLSEVLPERLINKQKQDKFENLISAYLTLTLVKGSEGKARRKALRRDIVSERNKSYAEYLNFRMKVRYQMIQRCPGLLGIIHPMYCKLYQIGRLRTGK